MPRTAGPDEPDNDRKRGVRARAHRKAAAPHEEARCDAPTQAVAYEQPIELTNDGIWRFDVVPSVSTRLPAREQAEGILARARLGFCNSALARLYGFERPEDLIGQPLLSWHEGTDEEKVRWTARFVTAGYRLVDDEAATQDRQGKTIWTLNNVAGIVKRGRIVGGWGVTHDVTDRKAVETALREALTHIRATLAAFPDLAFELDAEGRFHEYIVPDARQLYVPATVFLGKTIREVMPAEPAQIMLDALEEAVRTGSHRGAKYALDVPAGRRWYELSIARKGGGHGSGDHYIAIARDMTAQEVATAALRASEERLSFALGAASDGVYDVDLRSGDSYYSPGWYTMLGYAPDEFPPSQEAWESLLHPEDRERALEMLARCVTGDVGEAMTEFRLRTKTGEWRHIISRGRVVARDEDGTPRRLVGTHRDVTAQWEANDELRRERDRAQAYLDIAEVILVAIDRSGVIRLINRKGCRLLGYEDPQELIGRDWFETCLPQSAAEGTREIFRKMMAGDVGGVEYYENPIVTKSGQERVVAWHNALLWDGGRITGTLSSGEDVSERLRAEQALAKTVSLLSHSEETSHVGSWELDLVTGRLVWSDELYRIFGLEPGEIPPTDEAFHRILHPEDRDAVLAAYTEAVREKKDSYESLHRLVRRETGEIRYIHEKCAFGRDAAGVPVRVFGIVQDITARRRAEAAIRDSEEKYRLLVENAAEAVFVAQDGMIKFANPATSRIVGRSIQELRARPFPEFIYPDDRALVVERHRRRLAGEDPAGAYPFRVLHADGTARWVEISAVRIEWEGRSATLNFVSDVHERRAAEIALAESERKYRELANDLPTCVFETGLDGLLTYANRTGIDLFGYAEEEIIGRKGVAEMVIEPERERAMRTFRDAVERGQIPAGEYTAVRRDGTTFPALVSSRAIVRDGRAVGVRGILVDISERVQAAQRVERALAGTIHALAVTTEMRDPYTAGHQERVTRLAVAIGQRLGLDASRVEGLRVAGLLHDVGKVSVPAEILSKPSELSEIEMRIVRSHPETGHAILREIEFPWPVSVIVLQHHERMDGSGYPQGLRGDEILLEARILAVADTVAAMTSHRPYRTALGIDDALCEVRRGSGTLYDADIVAACVSALEEDGFRLDE